MAPPQGQAGRRYVSITKPCWTWRGSSPGGGKGDADATGSGRTRPGGADARAGSQLGVRLHAVGGDAALAPAVLVRRGAGGGAGHRVAVATGEVVRRGIA